MNFALLTGTLRSRWLLACTCMALLLGCQEQSPQSGEADDRAGAGGGSAGTSAAGSSSGTGGGPAGANTGGAMASANGGADSESPAGGGNLARGGSSSAGGSAGGNAGMESVAGSTGSSLATIRSAATWLDDQGKVVNAHGGGVIQVGDTFYLHGMYITYSANASSDANKTFKGFSMYSSRDLATWKSEGLVLPPQASGELGPNRIGERPHIIRCPSSGEFVLYAHAASLDYQTDKEVVYATSPTVNGKYAYRGALQNAAGVRAEHSDMSAFVDSENVPYVLTEGGHVYKLSSDCHSWLSDTNFGAIGGTESPTLFKAGGADPVSRTPDGASKLPESGKWQKNERSTRKNSSGTRCG